jgi:hypothetical protein
LVWFGRDATEKGVAGLTESLISSLFAISKGDDSVNNDKILAGKMAAINTAQYHPPPLSFSV